MTDNTKIYKMDHNGEWVVVDWTTGEVETLEEEYAKAEQKENKAKSERDSLGTSTQEI